MKRTKAAKKQLDTNKHGNFSITLCANVVCGLFSIVVRGALLHLELARTVGAAFWLRIARGY